MITSSSDGDGSVGGCSGCDDNHNRVGYGVGHCNNGGGVDNNRQVTGFAAEEYEFVPRKVRGSLPSPTLDRLRGTGRSFSEAERPGLETTYLCLMPL